MPAFLSVCFLASPLSTGSGAHIARACSGWRRSHGSQCGPPGGRSYLSGHLGSLGGIGIAPAARGDLWAGRDQRRAFVALMASYELQWSGSLQSILDWFVYRASNSSSTLGSGESAHFTILEWFGRIPLHNIAFGSVGFFSWRRGLVQRAFVVHGLARRYWLRILPEDLGTRRSSGTPAICTITIITWRISSRRSLCWRRLRESM